MPARQSPATAAGTSLVVPVYNGAALVPVLVAAVTPYLEASGEPFEIVLVDDGSVDTSWEAISTLAAANTHVRGIRLSRNFGQQIAVSAGIAHTQRSYVIVMDCDLQNPPAAIPQIIAAMREGNDVVYTVSRARNNFGDELTSWLFWFLLVRIFRVKIVEHQLMMRGMTARLARVYAGYPELTRTVAGITGDMGYKHAIIAVDNARRTTGRSGYSFFRRFNLMIDMIISITTAPLHLLIYVSLAVFLVTVVLALYFFATFLVTSVTSGFTAIILAIIFFGSLITLILGVIGIYLANIYTEVRRRPLFLVADRTPNDE